jgi:tetratricopeptide (TPR) repeat protein
MSLFGIRSALLFSTKLEWVKIHDSNDGDAPGRVFSGKYLRLAGHPVALGREIGRGEEAIVFELIDLKSGLFGEHVVKICRHRPGTPEYRRWAVPVRFQYNRGSSLTDIEFIPARLFTVDGGLVKVQRYVSRNPEQDWATRLPIRHLEAVAHRDTIGASHRLEELITTHGERAIFLEMKALLAANDGDLDNALSYMSRALASHIAFDSSSRYRAALGLSAIMDALYERDRSHGDSELSLKLPDGRVHRQTIFSSGRDAAEDDAHQERSVFALMEVMSDLPYLICGLEYLIESFTDSGEYDQVTCDLRKALYRIDPQNQMSSDQASSELKAAESGDKAVSANIDNSLIGHEPAGSEGAKVKQEIPPSALAMLAEHDRIYREKVQIVRSGNARFLAGISDFHQGHMVEAEKNFRQAIEMEPSEADHYTALATFYSTTGRSIQAIQVFREALAQLPGEPEIRFLLGRELLRAGELNEAERELLKAKPLLTTQDRSINLMLDEIAARRANK